MFLDVEVELEDDEVDTREILKLDSTEEAESDKRLLQSAHASSWA